MVQHEQVQLDAAFVALADSTRRGVLEQLGRSEASITELAGRFHMTLTGMKKHVSVLEGVGLVTTEKVGRVRTCRIGRTRLEDVAGWIERYQQLWDARFAALDDVVEQLKLREKRDERRNEQRADDGAPSGHRGAAVGSRDQGHPRVRRAGTPRLRGVDQA